MKPSQKIKWLLTATGITTYKIGKDIEESTQFLDRYKNDPEKIGGMRLEKAEKLLEYISNLRQEDVIKTNWNNQQILVQNSTEEEITKYFNSYPFAIKLNWIKPHKEMFIVNFDTTSNKTFRKYPYDLKNLYFLVDKNRDKMSQFAEFLIICGRKSHFGGSRVLYEVEGKKYQIIFSIKRPSELGSTIRLINVVETDTYRDDLVPEISEEESILRPEELGIEETKFDKKNDKLFKILSEVDN
ncbi:TPA: hypothetical protein ACKQ4H_001461 [Streptococcus pyogenes]|uniref:hypothetical protein n=1 Tax=Streptococcus pyogenes TaxID=1314 RepID=UPI0007C295C6|nr:hypothetical protein [Streptococcus pyogenes]HER4546000.1 hypothetical protein [Streptococcus pyogenes NGAS726]OAC67291.1 hypothetical protein AWU07_02775 [Streptococcus pyogenes]OAC77117.1 hypothetical protein AWT95_02995 [Streptococcus pyogenes]OAC79851.1 hypothetical protein AWT94_01605 [Streptococcus pyogenes]QCK54348.1 hypothetical protein ETT56_05285 [Streptococcus pyogenes]